MNLLLSQGIEKLFFIKQGPLKLMSGNSWGLTKVGEKLLSDLVKFWILSSNIPLAFDKLIQEVSLNYLMYFLVGINTK